MSGGNRNALLKRCVFRVSNRMAEHSDIAFATTDIESISSRQKIELSWGPYSSPARKIWEKCGAFVCSGELLRVDKNPLVGESVEVEEMHRAPIYIGG